MHRNPAILARQPQEKTRRAGERLSGEVVVQSGGHLQARRARLQARRADVEALCILMPRPVAPLARPVAPP